MRTRATLSETADIGNAMLIAEDEERCSYEPIGIVSTLREAREIARLDIRIREEKLMSDGDPGICPYVYKVYAQGATGRYTLAAEILTLGL